MGGGNGLHPALSPFFHLRVIKTIGCTFWLKYLLDFSLAVTTDHLVFHYFRFFVGLDKGTLRLLADNDRVG